ncbi:hypothetical protein T492DRAFT_887001 [Pavlovales sp. CCMP2436]|nr:hypothetical protein T492DRAFT_887001 [Pavlovales sp. CCMP2436]
MTRYARRPRAACTSPSLQSGTLPVLILRDFTSTGAHERAGGTCGRVQGFSNDYKPVQTSLHELFEAGNLELKGGGPNSYYGIVGMIEGIPGIGLARIKACRTAWDLGARSIDDVLEAARITDTLANTVRSTVEATLEARRLFQQRVE